MSMNGNPHYENAKYVHRAPELRIIDATLALAHEQRTANLIAAMQPVNLPDGEAVGLTIQKCAQIHAEVLERLGLE